VKSAGAANAKRAAIYYSDGGVPDGGTLHFALVDVDAGKEIWNLEQKMVLKNFEIGGFHAIRFTPPKIALSPDGHTLAVLLDGRLGTYFIPWSRTLPILSSSARGFGAGRYNGNGKGMRI
jgi:hypothetical protein